MKMGKSLGNVLDPVALVTAYGADAVRFFFLKEVDFGRVIASLLLLFATCIIWPICRRCDMTILYCQCLERS